MKSSSNKAITFPLIYVVLFIILIVSLITFGIKKINNSQSNIKSIGLVNNAAEDKKIARKNNTLVTARSGDTVRKDTNIEEKQENNNEEKTQNNENTEEATINNEETKNEEQPINENSENEEKKVEEESTKNVEAETEVEENQVVETEEDTEKFVSINDVQISKNMDLTIRTGLSRNDFIKLISNVRADTSGFFEENAGMIYDLCEQYSINEIFFCGLISAESGWNIAGNHRSTHNYISLMKNGKLIQYSSVEEGLRVAVQKLHNNYLTPGGKFYHGKTLKGVQTNYCPSPSWVDLVYGRMKQII